VASVLVTRIGFKPTLIAGLVLVAIGLVWFAQISPGGSYVGDVLFPSLVAAWGLGLAFVPVTIAAVTGTRPDEAGLASGLINTAQQVGGALGLAILAAVANGRSDDVPPPACAIRRSCSPRASRTRSSWAQASRCWPRSWPR
jgi:MFS family permease